MKFVCIICEKLKEFNENDAKIFFNNITSMGKNIKISDYPELVSMLDINDCNGNKQHKYEFHDDTKKLIEEIVDCNMKLEKDNIRLINDKINIDSTKERLEKANDDVNKRLNRYSEMESDLKNKANDLENKMIGLIGISDFSIFTYAEEDEVEINDYKPEKDENEVEIISQ